MKHKLLLLITGALLFGAVNYTQAAEFTQIRAFLDNNDSRQRRSFRVRIEGAIIKTAVAVRAELNTVPHHAERTELARQVLNMTDERLAEFVKKMERAALNSNSTLQDKLIDTPQADGAPDSDIEFVVSSLWSAFSTADPAATP